MKQEYEWEVDPRGCAYALAFSFAVWFVLGLIVFAWVFVW